jgi:hypothetical protein
VWENGVISPCILNLGCTRNWQPSLSCRFTLWGSAPVSIYFTETRTSPILMTKKNPRPSMESKPDPSIYIGTESTEITWHISGKILRNSVFTYAWKNISVRGIVENMLILFGNVTTTMSQTLLNKLENVHRLKHIWPFRSVLILRLWIIEIFQENRWIHEYRTCHSTFCLTHHNTLFYVLPNTP